MSEKPCKTCGHCPTCGHTPEPKEPAVAAGSHCPNCGSWMPMGTFHLCNATAPTGPQFPAMPWQQPVICDDSQFQAAWQMAADRAQPVHVRAFETTGYMRVIPNTACAANYGDHRGFTMTTGGGTHGD